MLEAQAVPAVARAPVRVSAGDGALERRAGLLVRPPHSGGRGGVEAVAAQRHAAVEVADDVARTGVRELGAPCTGQQCSSGEEEDHRAENDRQQDKIRDASLFTSCMIEHVTVLLNVYCPALLNCIDAHVHTDVLLGK